MRWWIVIFMPRLCIFHGLCMFWWVLECLDLSGCCLSHERGGEFSKVWGIKRRRWEIHKPSVNLNQNTNSLISLSSSSPRQPTIRECETLNFHDSKDLMHFLSFKATSIVRNSPSSPLIFYFHFSLGHPWGFHWKGLAFGFRFDFGLVLGMDNALVVWSASGVEESFLHRPNVPPFLSSFSQSYILMFE